MPNTLYPTGKAHIFGLATKVDLIADTIKVALIDTAVETYNAADEFYSAITSPVALSGALSGKTVTAGVFDCNDVTLVALTGPTVEALVVIKDTGVAATSPLIAWMDVTQFTPVGTDANVIWNASGLFAI